MRNSPREKSPVWPGPLGSPELGVRFHENDPWRTFYRERHPPRLSATRVSANDRKADHGLASQPTHEEVEWFITAIVKRYRFVLRIADAIMQRARKSLDNGPGHIRRPELAVIANDCGCHETTVQRAAFQTQSRPLGERFNWLLFFFRRRSNPVFLVLRGTNTVEYNMANTQLRASR